MKGNLELNKRSVDMFWKNKDNRLYKIVSVMEGVEPWVVDDVESVAKQVVLFGAKMGSVKISQLSVHHKEMTTVMTYICCGKALRMLNWIDNKFPGVSFHYVVEARDAVDWDAGKLLLDRLSTIKSLDLLAKIFTPMRTRLISGVLGSTDNDD